MDKNLTRVDLWLDTASRYGVRVASQELIENLKCSFLASHNRDGLFCYKTNHRSAKKMWLHFSLAVLLIGSVGFSLKKVIHFVSQKELFAISDPLRSIRGSVHRSDHIRILNDLSLAQKRRVASQVHFVSEIIGNTNKKADEKEIAVSIVSESIRANYDPLFIAAVVKSESTFKKNSISTKGARGLMQLLPNTAQFAKKKLVSPEDFTRGDIHNTDTNLQLGIAYLKHLEDLFSGDKELALIAYNWGPGNLLRALKTERHIPLEVVRYAKKILQTHHSWRGQLEAKKRQFQYFGVDGIA